MKKILLTVGKLLSALVFVLLLLFNTGSTPHETSAPTTALEDEETEFGLSKVMSVPLPSKLTFCEEEVPLNIYYVREALERELLINSYLHSSTIQIIKRSQRYFPVIEPILKAYQIPDDMKYLAVAESGLRNDVVSAAKAAGVWQFMKETARSLHLEVNDDIDERYHLEKSTIAACEYLQQLYQRFGSWSAAAAAYNMGPNGFERVQKKQCDSVYYHLSLNSETARYVYRILAFKTIFEHPKNYGYYLKNNELYPNIPTRKISVDTTITDLADFAIKQQVSFHILKEFNPWLRSYTMPDKSRKVYQILLPLEGYINYDQALETNTDEAWFEGVLSADNQ